MSQLHKVPLSMSAEFGKQPLQYYPFIIIGGKQWYALIDINTL